MITTSLDVICRRYLLDLGMPMHYYAEALFYATTCLRELSFDSLQIINCSNLPVDATGAINLPDDFVDDLAVCIPAGQLLAKLPKQDWITPLRIHDATTGDFVPYNLNDTEENETFFGFPLLGFDWFWNVDSFGSPTGGFYGARGGTNSGYKVLKQRRQIQLTEDFIGSNVVLLYISDGLGVDNASQIDPEAFSTINAFIVFKRSPNSGNDNSPEGRAYYNQKRLLRSRLNPLTPSEIRNILNNAYSACVKN